jgi:hypothetical protein
MQGSGKVQIKTSIKIYGTGTELPVMIEADFNKIPHNLHSIYYQTLVSQYNTSWSVYDNTKDDDKEPMTIEEQKREWRWDRIAKLLLKVIKR